MTRVTFPTRLAALGGTASLLAVAVAAVAAAGCRDGGQQWAVRVSVAACGSAFADTRQLSVTVTDDTGQQDTARFAFDGGETFPTSLVIILPPAVTRIEEVSVAALDADGRVLGEPAVVRSLHRGPEEEGDVALALGACADGGPADGGGQDLRVDAGDGDGAAPADRPDGGSADASDAADLGGGGDGSGDGPGSDTCGVLVLAGGSASAAHRDEYNVTDFTVEAWIRPAPDRPQFQNLVHHWGRSDQQTASWALYLNDLRPSVAFSCGGDMPRFLSGVNPVALDRWTHVAASFSSATGMVMVHADGVLVANDTVPCGRPAEVTQPLVIAYGDPNGGGPFHGAIDDVRLSNSARYAGGFTPERVLGNDPSTIALFHFGEGAGAIGATTRDASPLANDAMLTGAQGGATLTGECR